MYMEEQGISEINDVFAKIYERVKKNYIITIMKKEKGII